jgi:CRISPR/Cas system-associated exonuclease Cas4 (RecB family)
LTGLAVSLASRSIVEAKLAPISHLSREAIAANVIHRLKRDAIPYFSAVADAPGLARAIAGTAQELRLGETDLEQLAVTGAPGDDLARILRLYDAELSKTSVADFAVLLSHAAETAKAGTHRLIGQPVLLLDVDLKTRLERDLVRSVVFRSPATLAICLSGDPESAAILEEVIGAKALDIDDAAETSLAQVRRNLFSASPSVNVDQDQSVDFFSAAGEGLECVEIARRILAQAKGGLEFDQIAILLRGPERYQPLLEEALRRAGIPGWFSRGVARPDPAGRAFLSLLACASDHCSASRFAEYLSLGQVPPLGEANGRDRAPVVPYDEILASFCGVTSGIAAQPHPEPAVPDSDESPVIEGTLQSPAGWEKLLVDAAVIGGRDRWHRRLRGLEAEFRVRLREVAKEDDSERSYRERQLVLLQNLERFALPLIERLDALPDRASWKEWLEHLIDLAHAALRRPESVLSVLSELQAMEDVGPVDLDQVTGVLSDRLRFLRRDPPALRYGRVFVGTIEEARGRSFEIVFLPGLAEGLFPRKVFEDAILLDDYRRILGDLPIQDDRVRRERMLLHIGAGAASSKLIFSYPRIDVSQSRPRVPSFYALEIIRAARGRLPDLRTFENAAAKGAPSRLDWPAPSDPSQAIDEAEFDLSALGHTLGLEPNEAAATGRYLIDVNQALVRSLRARARRWRKGWSFADGIVEPDAPAIAALANYRLSKRAYSPSALQQFASCPYRFLLYAAHQLKPREEAVPLEQMDPLTRGALFHRVQFELFRELTSRSLVPIVASNVGSALKLADQVLNRVAAGFEEQLAPAIPRVWASEIEDLRMDLRGWLRQKSVEDSDWAPIHFEYSFGLALDSEHDPASTTEAVTLESGVQIRGVIDLVERRRERGSLRVTDHKTGKAPERAPVAVGGGSALQPLMYALAAEQLFRSTAESGRLSYCTQRGGYQHIDIAADPRNRAFLSRVFQIVDSHIERGFLPAAPARDACAFCDYRPICGPYEQLRTGRKNARSLEELTELRGIQ